MLELEQPQYKQPQSHALVLANTTTSSSKATLHSNKDAVSNRNSNSDVVGDVDSVGGVMVTLKSSAACCDSHVAGFKSVFRFASQLHQ